MLDSAVRILLVEGRAGTVHLLRLALRELGGGFELTRADGLASALDHVARSRFDVVLLDPALTDAAGPEAVKRLRRAAPDVPLLLLASAADVGLCLRAMEEGAHDYLFKDVLTTHLLVRMIRDAVERFRPSGPAGGLLIDPVTRLYTRDGLLGQAAQLWRSPGRLRKGATLLHLALDDALESGDHRALLETADILRETFRGSDLRARIDGGEFAVLAVGAPEVSAPILTARLEESLQGYNAQDGRDYYLVLRMGSAHYDAERPCTIEDMFATARARLGSTLLGRQPISADHAVAAS
jgi:two-component system, cell cycle response regulator